MREPSTKCMLAYAKINAYLAVTGRREDGYHTLLTHMQAVTLHDTLILQWKPIVQGKRDMHLSCDHAALPTDGNNLVCRAANAFFDALASRGHDVSGRLEIHMQKRIPMAAGLGGGSADAAATLWGLNDLFGAPLCLDELCKIGATLGADIPFCVRSVAGVCNAATARGIGELLTPTRGLPSDWFLVIACHGEGVSTPWAYRRLDEQVKSVSEQDVEEAYTYFLAALEQCDAQTIGVASYNCFETVVLPERPEARALMQTMKNAGAVLVRMSGSGPSVVGCFTDENAAHACCAMLTKMGIVAHLCQPL